MLVTSARTAVLAARLRRPRLRRDAGVLRVVVAPVVAASERVGDAVDPSTAPPSPDASAAGAGGRGGRGGRAGPVPRLQPPTRTASRCRASGAATTDGTRRSPRPRRTPTRRRSSARRRTRSARCSSCATRASPSATRRTTSARSWPCTERSPQAPNTGLNLPWSRRSLGPSSRGIGLIELVDQGHGRLEHWPPRAPAGGWRGARSPRATSRSTSMLTARCVDAQELVVEVRGMRARSRPSARCRSISKAARVLRGDAKVALEARARPRPGEARCRSSRSLASRARCARGARSRRPCRRASRDFASGRRRAAA